MIRKQRSRNKRIYKSFTCDDPSARGKRKAEAMATEWADNKEIKKDEEVQMTFGDALEKYIHERSDQCGNEKISSWNRNQYHSSGHGR